MNHSSLEDLARILADVQNIALQVHEQFEREGQNPLLEFEFFLLGQGRRFSQEVRATTLWNCLLFGRARLALQQKFQNAVSMKMPSAEAALVARHMMCSAPHTWSFRHSYQHGFGHVTAGPRAHAEITIDGGLSCAGAISNEEHLFAFGWVLPFRDQTFLLYATELTKDQIYRVEKYRPFPLQLREDDYWEDNHLEILRLLHAPETAFSKQVRPAPKRTDYAPELTYERFGRIVHNTLSATPMRLTCALHTTVALGDAPQIRASVDALVGAFVSGESDAMRMDLKTRLLEAIGCESDGSMPKAHDALLMGDPIALLLLPESCALFQELSPRDRIKKALAFEKEHGPQGVAEAFAVYQRERRWLAAFPCFDLTREEHAAKFGIPIEAIKAVFSPKLLRARLPITPQSDVLRQLQNKYGFYQNGNTPEFLEVVEAMGGRAFFRTGNMTYITQWILQCCERWRNCLCEVEPEITNRTINASTQSLLHKGLRDLSALFKK